jgi:hypothetical protein
MQPAVIFSIPTNTSRGYCWRWRSADSKAESQKQFAYYYECLLDAQTKGYVVQLAVAQGETAPSRWSLRDEGTGTR